MDARSLVQLRKAIPAKAGIADFLARKLKFRRSVRVNLDDRGSFYWTLIDGKTDLRTIARRIRKQYSMKEEESRSATILFTKMLMTRNVIYLKIDDDAEA